MRPQPAMAIRRRGQHLGRRHRSGDLRRHPVIDFTIKLGG
jgi:hypothetical protein